MLTVKKLNQKKTEVKNEKQNYNNFIHLYNFWLFR